MRLNLFGRAPIPRRIDLGDLARAFWQDRPMETGRSEVHDLSGTGAERSWTTSAFQNFWLQYVRPYRSTLSPPVFQTIEALLDEIEKLEKCPSVFEDDEETPKQYLALSRIPLVDHTLNVCREAVDLLKARENDFQMNVGKTLIAALGHDMGKHPTAVIPNMPHAFKSAVWLQKRIGHLRDREQIIAAVRLHHSENNLRKIPTGNPVLAVLIQADLNARRKELAEVQGDKPREQFNPPPPGHSLKDIDPKGNETHPEAYDRWFSKDSFLKHLHSRISCNGFDAFCFDKQVYFSPSVVKQALNQMRQRHGLPVIPSRSEIQKRLCLLMPEIRNEKCRLRFKSNFRPVKRWFFVMETSQFGASEKMNTDTPRNLDGRWLKHIDHSI